MGESREEAYLLKASRFQHHIFKDRGARQQEVMWPNALRPVYVIRSHLQDRRLTTASGCVGHVLMLCSHVQIVVPLDVGWRLPCG